MSEAIFVQGLTKSYDEKTVVDHLNLSVPRGTVFGLLGANGAGKSTTIECILGTKRPEEGTVRLLGLDPLKHRRRLFQEIGVQFQEGDHPRRSRFPKSVKKLSVCTVVPAIGAGCANSLALVRNGMTLLKIFPAVNGSDFSSCWH